MGKHNVVVFPGFYGAYKREATSASSLSRMVKSIFIGLIYKKVLEVMNLIDEHV